MQGRSGDVGSDAGAPVTVLVIAKEPVPGRVKTRLCPPCSAPQAARIAEAALADTLAAVAGARVGRRVVVLDGASDGWLPIGFDVVAQVGGGLGERLAAAFAAVEPPALVVGMDTPQVSALAIESAAEWLCSPGTDAVLGPALDGGYWTIGFDRAVPDAFEGVPMSTPDTAEQQMNRLCELDLSVRCLEPLRDIDRWEDALAVAETHPDLRTSAAVRQVETEAVR